MPRAQLSQSHVETLPDGSRLEYLMGRTYDLTDELYARLDAANKIEKPPEPPTVAELTAEVAELKQELAQAAPAPAQ